MARTVRRSWRARVLALLVGGGWIGAAPEAGATEPLWPSLSEPPSGLSGGERDAAVIVGIENYTYIADIPGAAQNAIDWYRYLEARGVPAHKIRLLVDPIRDGDGRIPTDDPQGTNDGILAAAAQAAADVEEGGTLWFVYIGHGAPAQSGDDGLLVGVDASGTARGIYSRSAARSKVLAALAEGRQANTVVVLDTCFSGRTPGGAPLVADLQPVIPVGLSVESAATVLAATSSNQFAGPLPGAGRPAFSYLVLGALQGWGDADGDGNVTAREAITYARNTLLTLVTDRQQEPQLEGGDGDLVLGQAVLEGPDISEIRLAMVGGGSGGGPSSSGGTGLPSFDLGDVTAMLAEQQCDRVAFDEAARQQRDALAEAQETDREAIEARWSELAEQAEACAQLDDDAMRARCHEQVTVFAEALEGREVVVEPRLVEIETECGARSVAAEGLTEVSTAAAAVLVQVRDLLSRYDGDHRLTDPTGTDVLDVSGPARHRESLRAGFGNDPRTFAVDVGWDPDRLVGTSELDLGSGCVGYVDPSGPALSLEYRAGRGPLRIAVCDEEDTTLLVYGPNGWVCDDDGGPGTNPEIVFDSPASGTYQVFVGMIGMGWRSTADLYVSELLSPTFCEEENDRPSGEASGGPLRHDVPARYGTLTLDAGFSNDPRTIVAEAGGAPSSRQEVRDLSLGEGCRGVVDPSRPDLSVAYTAGTYTLRFAACASEDTALVVRGPTGQWYCDDDDGPGLNPDVRIGDPQSGEYDVWFSSVNGGNHRGTLYVTERSLLEPCEEEADSSTSTTGGRPNISGEPRYGEAILAAGFYPDPYRASVRAGGATDVRTQNLDPSCRGYIATDRPDYRIRYTAGQYTLRVAACSDADTTLVINDASGQWHCSDDAEGRNPVVTWTDPPSGVYDVWVGKYNSGEAPAELRISEGSGPYCD